MIDVPEFRERYIHSTAAGYYALCLGLYKAEQQGVAVEKAVDALAGVDWQRPTTGPSFWDGSLIVVQEQPDGSEKRKMSAGRTAYEEAGERLVAVATQAPKSVATAA